MANPQDTQPVKIFQRTYELPSLAGGQIQSIQNNIQTRQNLIQSGQKVVEVIKHEQVKTSGFLGLRKGIEMRQVVQRQIQPLSPEERFHTLEAQIQDYDRLMALLKQHKSAYQQFLGALCDEVQDIIHQKFQQITQAEQTRAEFQREAEAEQDSEMISLALEQKRGLLQSLVELGKVARLFFKKIEYISQGIEKLSQDSEGSKQFLQKMVKKLKVYKKGMESQRAIAQVKQDIAQLTQVALDLESYLQDALGPLQGLISSISEVDGQLTRTVEEIRNLSAELVSGEGGMFDFSSAQDVVEGLLSFEVARVQKQTRLKDALEAAQTEGITVTYTAMELSQEAVAQLSIAEQIQTIQTKVQQEVNGFQGRITIAVDAVDTVQILVPERSSSRVTISYPLAESTQSKSLFVSPVAVSREVQLGNTTFKLPKNGGILEFIAVPGGTLTMEGVHKVNLQPFLMGKYPITQQQYQAIMGQNPSNFKGENRPVEAVNWHEAGSFCQKLSEILGQQIDLPSETQWEWAARGATQSQGFEYAGSNNLDEVGWYEDNSGNETHPVGQKKPNELGLYDLSGNVWEWCQDNYTSNVKDLPRDGTAWLSSDESKYPLLRGGSWLNTAKYCRSASRYNDTPANRYNLIGFRVVCRSSRTR